MVRCFGVYYLALRLQIEMLPAIFRKIVLQAAPMEIAPLAATKPAEMQRAIGQFHSNTALCLILHMERRSVLRLALAPVVEASRLAFVRGERTR